MKKYGWEKTDEVRDSNFVEYTSPQRNFKAVRNEEGEWHLYTVPANYQDVPEYMNTYDTLEGCTMGAHPKGYSVHIQAESNEERLQRELTELNREFDIVDGACDYWKQEAEDLQSQVEYLKKQIVLMA